MLDGQVIRVSSGFSSATSAGGISTQVLGETTVCGTDIEVKVWLCSSPVHGNFIPDTQLITLSLPPASALYFSFSRPSKLGAEGQW